jgi:hypothetical protein
MLFGNESEPLANESLPVWGGTLLPGIAIERLGGFPNRQLRIVLHIMSFAAPKACNRSADGLGLFPARQCPPRKGPVALLRPAPSCPPFTGGKMN